MFVANARDLRFTPMGMLTQKRIASPKMRYFTPRARRCAANERPYGPAPIIATSVPGFILITILPRWPGIDVESAHRHAPTSISGRAIPNDQLVRCVGPEHWLTEAPTETVVGRREGAVRRVAGTA